MRCCLLFEGLVAIYKNLRSERNAKKMTYCEFVQDSKRDAIIIAGCDFSVIGMNPAIGVPFYRHLLFFNGEMAVV